VNKALCTLAVLLAGTVAACFAQAANDAFAQKTEFRISETPAGLQVCNKTEHRVAVAVGYRGKQGLTSEGWWNLQPRSCQQILTRDLTDRYYYVLGRDLDIRGGWGGDLAFCVATKTFTIVGNGNCFLRGFRSFGFMKVDVGGEAEWTVSLHSKNRNR
jgi:uncharacterized membrane protein